MPNFDFHSTLSPVQFERLIRDILEIKFKGVSFRAYATGRDRGIDIKSVDAAETIICQTKLYQNKFSQLLASLRQDVKKIRKHKATKYIIATSCVLTNSNIQEIRDLFQINKITLQENDIWDRELLNQFLSQAAFKPVLKTHFNLFLTDITVLEESLRGVVNNSIIQRSMWELHNISDEAKYYVETYASKAAIKQILEERLIFLTGTAGCGKTTTAKIIINTLLNILPGNKEFIKLRSIDEAEAIYNPEKQQIFLFDDYWGQFTEEVHEHHAGNRAALPDFIKRVRRSKHHYIVITSRDYIIQNEGIQKQQALKEIIDEHRLIIQISDLNHQERAHILIRHLYHSDYDRCFLAHLYSLDTLDKIVTHRNYNPRLICEFIHKRFKEIEKDNPQANRHGFYFHLERHLDSPDFFWYNLIKAQNDSARLLLFVIVISSSNNTQEEIRFTFEKCVEICIAKGLEVSVKDFKQAERLLEDGFIELTPLPRLDSWRISFKNGSIADVVLKYLKEEAVEWIPILLEGFIFFNQLAQNFTAISRQEGTNKIILESKNKSIIIQRILSEFWTLYDEAVDLKIPNFKTTQFVERCYRISTIFDLKEELEVREFLMQIATRIINLMTIEPKFQLDRDNTFYLPSFVGNLRPWINIDVPPFLEKVFYSFDYFDDFKQFIKFKLVFPNEFEQFVVGNKKKIKDYVDDFVIDTLEMMDEFEIDMFFDLEYYDILKGLRLRHSKRIREYLDQLGTAHFEQRSKPVKRKKGSRQKKASSFLGEYRKKIKPYLKLLKQYIAEDYSINEKLSTNKFPEMEMFHQQTLEQIYLLNPSVKKNEFLSFLKALAIDSYDSHRWYTEQMLADILKAHSEVNEITNLDCSPAFQQQEKWFTLCSPYAGYLIALYCKDNVNDVDYYNEISNIIEGIHPQNTDLFEWLMKIDPGRFKKLFIIPTINEFLSKIDFTNSIAKGISCSALGDWSVDISFKKYRGKVIEINDEGGGAGDMLNIEMVTRFLGIAEEFGFYGSEMIYLLNDIKNKTPQVFDDFVSYCQRNIPPEKRRHIFQENIVNKFSLKLPKELANPDFLRIAESCGWIAKLSDIIDSLSRYINS